MNIQTKTQTQTDLDSLEQRVAKTVKALEFTASQLNLAYDAVWNLPDDRLQALLQELINTGKFEEIFTVHATAAVAINQLLVSAGSQSIAKETAGREYEISEQGVVTIIPLPEIIEAPAENGEETP